VPWQPTRPWCRLAAAAHPPTVDGRPRKGFGRFAVRVRLPPFGKTPNLRCARLGKSTPASGVQPCGFQITRSATANPASARNDLAKPADAGAWPGQAQVSPGSFVHEDGPLRAEVSSRTPAPPPEWKPRNPATRRAPGRHRPRPCLPELQLHSGTEPPAPDPGSPGGGCSPSVTYKTPPPPKVVVPRRVVHAASASRRGLIPAVRAPYRLALAAGPYSKSGKRADEPVATVSS